MLPAMKIPLTYGFIMTLCGAFVSLGLFFSGLHSDPDKLKLAQTIALVLGVVISVTCTLLGMREKRANTPADKPWGYGAALGTGVMIGLFGTIFGAVYNYCYFAFIDPSFQEVVLQAQIAALEAKNLSSAQIEQAEPYIRPWLKPGAMTATGAVMAFIWSLVISLIVAAFVKARPDNAAPVPPVASA
jgi:hypothetical protein